jgi:hypothetical protein
MHPNNWWRLLNTSSPLPPCRPDRGTVPSCGPDCPQRGTIICDLCSLNLNDEQLAAMQSYVTSKLETARKTSLTRTVKI